MLRAVWLGVGIWVLACAAPRGGWDMDRLLLEEPQIAELASQRLGDLTPYPALVGGAVKLITCRWPTRRPIRVRLRLSGEREGWARHAVESLSRGSSQVQLEILSEPWMVPDSAALIDVVEVAAEEEPGPGGAGDTLVSCDLSSRPQGALGILTRAEIEMRIVRRDILDRPVPLSAEEWTGAFMHELAHALGFQGHVGSGGSVLVLDQDRLRRAGRRALSGADWRDDTLEALYLLESGRLLGSREISSQTQYWLDAVEARLGGRGFGPWASVGDRNAQLEWRTEKGTRLRLRFPDWLRQLNEGRRLIAFPSPETRALLAAGAPPGEAGSASCWRSVCDIGIDSAGTGDQIIGGILLAEITQHDAEPK
jgi:hypothetical protein